MSYLTKIDMNEFLNKVQTFIYFLMSTVSQICEYLESQNEGTTFINGDFSSYGDDASTRSIILNNGTVIRFIHSNSVV